ncbi:endonuclease/exonuclease/phosphatase family protein [Rhizobium panacihumi]|uniref:endonuclease/exonuclease/phosphatase family protein n=1 Tax=Rhizobium panacihumi TaxID=2008450 RepID=UPI003D79C1BB
MKSKLLIAATFATSLASITPAAAQAQTERVTVMAFNVENFFDNVDDPRMPNGENAEVINTAEWVAAKGAAIARVIQRFDFGKGPDIIVLPEVESDVALQAIRTSLDAGGAAYPTAVLVDVDPNRPEPKPDQRGIKVGILSKLAASSEPKSIAVDLTTEPACNRQDGSKGVTRDLVQVDLAMPDGSTLTLIGAHLPSGGNPRICRELGAQAIATAAAHLPSDRVVVAAGDFNFNCAPDERRALANSLPNWILPAELDNGCRGDGSQYFARENTWSYLDVITQPPGLAQGQWKMDPRSFQVVHDDFEQFFWDENNKVMRPKAFRFNQQNGKGSGVSDHWPIAIDLVKSAAP